MVGPTRYNFALRSSMRGLRKCTGCNQYNGSRAKGCFNINCPLFHLKQREKRSISRIDPVQLICYKETKISSVRLKDRDPNQRSFVQITDVTLSSDSEGSIISRNAICYVDTCKYDSSDVNISCKHVKSASECSIFAEELKISKDVLYSLNINKELKDGLWKLYEEHEENIPSVQRINKSTFVLKCNTTNSFLAGRLHVTVAPDDAPEFNYSCACKKLRILLSPNNSVVLENDICDHLTLLLTALLSSEEQRSYKKFTNSLNRMWIKCPTSASTLGNNIISNEELLKMSENILNSCIEFDSADHLNNVNILENDPNMIEPMMEEDEIKLISFSTDNDGNQFETENLELAECQIELMDQFKLTNQIDLCSDEIHLCESDFFNGDNVICNFNDALEVTPVQSDNNSNDGPTSIPDSTPHIFNKAKKINIGTHKKESQLIKPPTIDFYDWFEFIIESINLSLNINSTNNIISHTFKIKDEFFTYLCKKFSVGEKRRLPNSTTLVKDGIYKGLTKSTYIFTTFSTVKRIFTTEKISIQMERSFMEKSSGYFVPYKYETSISVKDNKNLKRILPTVYKVFIQFGNKNKSGNGFVIGWIPNVYPHSRFGLLKVEFPIGFKKNNEILKMSPVAAAIV